MYIFAVMPSLCINLQTERPMRSRWTALNLPFGVLLLRHACYARALYEILSKYWWLLSKPLCLCSYSLLSYPSCYQYPLFWCQSLWLACSFDTCLMFSSDYQKLTRIMKSCLSPAWIQQSESMAGKDTVSLCKWESRLLSPGEPSLALDSACPNAKGPRVISNLHHCMGILLQLSDPYHYSPHFTMLVFPLLQICFCLKSLHDYCPAMGQIHTFQFFFPQQFFQTCLWHSLLSLTTFYHLQNFNP